MIKDLTTLARDALAVQDAVNLSGIAHSLSNDVLPSLRAAGINDTEAINNHPATRMFVAQMAYLSGLGAGDTAAYNEAYSWCRDNLGH